jgi:hypothetical protein
MNIVKRQPLQERGGTTSSEGTQGQASFHYGELPVVERLYRVRMQASYTCFPCSAIRAEDVCRRVARSGHSSTERPEQFFIDEAEQDDADASLHWTRGYYTARADAEGQLACKRASGSYQSAEAYGG